MPKTPSSKTRPPPDPDRFNEAVDWHRRRVPMTDKEWRELQEKERANAFKVAGVTQARVVQEVFDAVDRAVTEGETFDEFRTRVGAELGEAWGGEDPVRLESVFRTNVQQAYSAGRQTIFDAPAVRKARPYRRHDTITDGRDCPICTPLDGKILPADDPFWKTHTCPLHPGCRCLQTALSQEEAEAEGISTRPPDSPDPVDGFGNKAKVKGRDWSPDWFSFDPSIRDDVKDRAG